MVESQGKVSEKSGNFEMDIEWQPSVCQFTHLWVSNTTIKGLKLIIVETNQFLFVWVTNFLIIIMISFFLFEY